MFSGCQAVPASMHPSVTTRACVDSSRIRDIELMCRCIQKELLSVLKTGDLVSF